MFLSLSRFRGLLSTSSAGVPDAPAGPITFGRQNAAWIDVENVVSIDLEPASLNLNDAIWITRTGKFSASGILDTAITNAPFQLASGETYSFYLGCFKGVDSHQQRLTVQSSYWKGERYFIRDHFGTTPAGGVTTKLWKELNTYYSQIETGTTSAPLFTTILTHPLADDTSEEIEFLVYGRRTSGPFAQAYFGVVASVNNIAGVSTVIGATVFFQHKTIGVVAVRVIDDGSTNCLLQVRGTIDDWEWKVKAGFNEVRI